MAVARFIRVIRDASREVGFVAGSAEHLFDAFRLLAAQALGSPEVNKETVRSLAVLGDPAEILAAIFVQKSFGGRARIQGAHRRGGKSLRRGGLEMQPIDSCLDRSGGFAGETRARSLS